jgi:hypothetical protein
MLDAGAAHMGRCSCAERQNGFADKVIDEAADVRLASRPAQLQYAHVQRSDWGAPDRDVDLKGVHAVIVFPYRRN